MTLIHQKFQLFPNIAATHNNRTVPATVLADTGILSSSGSRMPLKDIPSNERGCHSTTELRDIKHWNLIFQPSRTLFPTVIEF